MSDEKTELKWTRDVKTMTQPACCEKIVEALTEDSYGQPNPQLIFDGGEWGFVGCCADRYGTGDAGCYIAADLKFCPWCGAPLPKT